MAENTGLSKNAILTTLTKSPHGSLKEYMEVGARAAKEEPEFSGRLIAWDRHHGQIRDFKVAMPVIYLAHGTLRDEFVSNAMAHLALLSPRDLVRAYRFSKDIGADWRSTFSFRRQMRRLVERYLRALEGNGAKFERVAVQHRRSLQELYSLIHLKPRDMANVILFGRTLDKVPAQMPVGSVFDVIAHLKDMSPAEASAVITQRRIPSLIAEGALGAKAKEPEAVMALIDRMTPTELVTKSKKLERLGVKTVPILRAAYEQALARAGSSKKATFKVTQALMEADDAIVDESLRAKLGALQEKQIKALGGVDGNWLVLGDASPSMEACIDAARRLAATLAKMVKGQVHLVFFNSVPRMFDVTGMEYEKVLAETKYVMVGGGTSIGCGLMPLLDKKDEIDGIAIVSDAQENSSPRFTDVYRQYSTMLDKQVPVYLYRFEPGSRGPADVDLAKSMKTAGFDLQEFDVRGKFDYYSLPNLVQTMRTNRYGLIQEVLDTPLLDLETVLPRREHAVAV